jgi:hypothetical protein
MNAVPGLTMYWTATYRPTLVQISRSFTLKGNTTLTISEKYMVGSQHAGGERVFRRGTIAH